jgi:hypothetical protein
VNARAVAAVALALVLGAGAGYAVASVGDDAPVAPVGASTTAGPVPATPSLPVPVVSPDPDDPALTTGLALRTVTLAPPAAPARRTRVTLPVPAGWTQYDNGTDRYSFDPDPETDDKDYTYVLYVEFVDDASPEAGVRRRTAELDSAAAQGNMTDLEVTLTPTGDGFDSSYIDSGGFRRVSFERWYPGPDGRAYVTVRATGRERDRQGLDDLISRISFTVRVAQRP